MKKKLIWKEANTLIKDCKFEAALVMLDIAKRKNKEISRFIEFNINIITKKAPNIKTDLVNLYHTKESEIKKDAETIRTSKYFDAAWYIKEYSDFLGDIDPAEHFLQYASFLLLNPSENFITSFYLDTHPGAWQKKINHLIRFTEEKYQLRPAPTAVLYSTDKLFKEGKKHFAIQYAESFLPENLKFTANILRANLAIEENKESDWLKSFNAYTKNYETPPITLKKAKGSIFDRISVTEKTEIKTDKSLISVIMPAWNAEKTIEKSVESILNQTWSNLELIIIDDASTDGTWNLLNKIKEKDSRVKTLRNSINVGPYVSKNIGLSIAKGEWITGHDADDWAFPTRLELHIKSAIEKNLFASIAHMIRMTPNGKFDHIGKIGSFSPDGVIRIASISCLFKHSELKEKLGFWDSVRFGADSELIARAELVLGENFGVLNQLSMICLSLEDSLTNNPITGVRTPTGLSPVRVKYRESWTKWHKDQSQDKRNFYLPFPQTARCYDAPNEMIVGLEQIKGNLNAK